MRLFHSKTSCVAFSRAQVLFLGCLTLVAFEIGMRMAEHNEPPKAQPRKTNVITSAPLPQMTTQELKEAPPVVEIASTSTATSTNTPVVTNEPPVRLTQHVAVATSPVSKNQYPSGGGAMPQGVNYKPQTTTRKLQSANTRQAPTGASQQGVGVRIALP